MWRATPAVHAPCAAADFLLLAAVLRCCSSCRSRGRLLANFRKTLDSGGMRWALTPRAVGAVYADSYLGRNATPRVALMFRILVTTSVRARASILRLACIWLQKTTMFFLSKLTQGVRPEAQGDLRCRGPENGQAGNTFLTRLFIAMKMGLTLDCRIELPGRGFCEGKHRRQGYAGRHDATRHLAGLVLWAPATRRVPITPAGGRWKAEDALRRSRRWSRQFLRLRRGEFYG